MTIEIYISYLIVVAVFFATPPDTSQLLIISTSLRHGVRRSLATVAGDLTANSLQMSAAAFGLAAVISLSSEIFQFIKWMGVLYLVYIGYSLLVTQSDSRPANKLNGSNGWQLFRQGFFTSSANPYAIAFFAALFPQFIDQNGNIIFQLIVLGGTYLVVDGIILILWGMFAVKAFASFKSLTAVRLNRISGALMILAALYLATSDRLEAEA